MIKWTWTKRNRACLTYSYLMDNLAGAQNSYNFYSELNLQQLNFEVGRYRANLPPSTFCYALQIWVEKIKCMVREDGRKIVIKKICSCLFVPHISSCSCQRKKHIWKTERPLIPQSEQTNLHLGWDTASLYPPATSIASLPRAVLLTHRNEFINRIASVSNWNAVICSDFIPNIWLFQSFLAFNLV